MNARWGADHVVNTALNRPRQKDAITAQMTRELARAVIDARDNDDVGDLVMSGAGQAFRAGGDIKAMLATRDRPDERQNRMRFHHYRWLDS